MTAYQSINASVTQRSTAPYAVFDVLKFARLKRPTDWMTIDMISEKSLIERKYVIQILNRFYADRCVERQIDKAGKSRYRLVLAFC